MANTEIILGGAKGNNITDTEWMDFDWQDLYANGEIPYFIVDVRNFNTLEIAQTWYNDSYRQIDVFSGVSYSSKTLLATIGTVKDQVYTIDISAVDYLLIARHYATAGVGCKGKYRLLV